MDERLGNIVTKMNISVTGYQEVAGPLGGLSVEYILDVTTTRPEFKTSYQSESSTVHFTVSKTFREIEYLCKKLKGKYPSANISTIESSSHLESKDERQEIANKWLNSVSKEPALVSSKILFDFFNYNPSKNQQEVSQPPNRDIPMQPSRVVDIFDDDSTDLNKQRSIPSRITAKQTDDLFTNDSDDDDQDLFQELTQKHVSAAPVSLFSESPPKAGKGEHLLFERQNLGGPLERREEQWYVPKDALIEDNNANRVSAKLETSTELLKIDENLTDILDEIQHKQASSGPPKKTKPVLPPKPTAAKPPVPTLREPMTKPTPSPRPNIGVSGRPVPPPRTKPAATGSSAQPYQSADGARHVPAAAKSSQQQASATPAAAAADFASVDILSYIEAEENARQSESEDLFA